MTNLKTEEQKIGKMDSNHFVIRYCQHTKLPTIDTAFVIESIKNCRQTILTTFDGRRLSANKTSDEWRTGHLLFCACLLLLYCVIFLSGCETKMPLQRQMSPLPPGPVCRVAVLPFLNNSDFPLAESIVNKIFATQLQESGNYMVTQEGEILKVYQQLRIFPRVEPSREQLVIIANRISAQLLITGIVLEMRIDRGEHGSANPMLLMEIHIRDGRSGETLWTTVHRRQGTDYKKTMHFGTIHTVTGLSRQMAVEIINLWFEKGLNQCDILPRS